MDHPDDHSLIVACLDGDREAWATLIQRYERLIFSIPVRYGLSESQASDIFQDVCLIMLEKLDHLRDESRLASWIGTVTRRECWKAMRRRDAAGAQDPVLLLAEQPTREAAPEEIVAEWEAWQAVRLAMEALGERCRELLHHLYYRTPTPSYEMISEELGIAIGSIGPTRARCLKKLHHALRGEHYRVEA